MGRRALLLAGMQVAAGATAAYAIDDNANGRSHDPLDDFIHRYLREMNAPGLTLGLANRSGTVRTASFGFADLEAKTPLTPEMRFQIGSISKSFVALTLLQLRDEGKLDLDQPILEYLPWLPIETGYGVITVHHLLTHTSGLPDSLNLFASDPSWRHVQGFKPGEHFYYCNVGFSILGHLISKLDGRPWTQAIRERIMTPLGMTASRAIIDDTTRSRRPSSYKPFYEDRPYPRQGRLAEAEDLVFDDAAGSVLSTPGDMARYMRMILNRGTGPNGRIVSEDGFARFSKSYIKAPEFSPTASYGYGIAVDKLGEHTILRHTGGMDSFASAIMIDLDGGVAAFASINAMQGFRPNAVVEYAVRLMGFDWQQKGPQKAPVIPDVSVIDNAADYTGVYTSPAGRQVEVKATGKRLELVAGGISNPLEATGGDAFVSTGASYAMFPILFGRSSDKRVAELSYGSEWYFNEHYAGPKEFPTPPGLEGLTGYYRADSAWVGTVQIVLRKGQLWMDGAEPLEREGGNLFRVAGAPVAMERVEFGRIVDGRPRILKVSGVDLWRIERD
ncbi:MAG TPA: serine hydrolase domain-containing protein [Bryobacteraceae bacterium]|nr:serine hydrolase domain-containing protein [Bryobacteraceae bacterium]